MIRKFTLTLFLLGILSLAVTAQNRTISGKVTDDRDNAPLPGVTVTVKNSTVATQTNEEGTFSLQVPQGSETLVFSFIGYHKKEVRIGNQSQFDVSLESNEEALDEVVVVGYGTMKKKEITSAVTSVKAKDFNPGGTRSPLDLIQGKVAGLVITRTQGNNPNSSAAVQMRGVSSINGTRSPLIVIDGIPGGNLDLVQQDDIESFDVLKDGSAAAIYGTRANAGVILITTKKGNPEPLGLTILPMPKENM